MKAIISVGLLLSIALAGCETTGPKQNAGAGIGAIAGALVGSQIGGGTGERIAGGVIGAVAGGLIGGAIGAGLDAQDKKRLDEITLASLKTGSVRSFRSPRTGARVKTHVVSNSTSNGRQCRTVQQDVVLVDGRVSRDTVKGCKGLNGWSV